VQHLHITNLWINSLLYAFGQAGLDIDTLIKGFPGFKNGQLQEGHPLPLSMARTLWHRAEQLSDDPLLGATIGVNQNFRSSGVLMPICWHSPDAMTALQHIANFQKLISENGLYRISESDDGERIHCEYIPSANAVATNQQQILSVIVGTLILLQEITGKKIILERLMTPSTIRTDLLAKQLQCPVEAHAGNFSLIMDKCSLRHPVMGRDEQLYQINLAYAEGMLHSQREHQTLVEQITFCIDVEHPAQVTMKHIVAELGMQERVIQRHLLEQHTSFRQLKSKVLKQRCLELLIHRNLDPEDVAQTLGYSETSAFYRAFKLWFGATPKQFKQQKITPTNKWGQSPFSLIGKR